jgi:hypothetical protein
VQRELAKYQRQANSVQVQLDLQTTENNRIIEGLKKQIADFESRPSQEAAIVELREQLQELDVLLSRKNEEIENNDDVVMR